jgi:hypothetical protein
LSAVNPAEVAKVVDENGEPLVVYHGTPKTGIEVTPKGADILQRQRYGLPAKKKTLKHILTGGTGCMKFP